MIRADWETVKSTRFASGDIPDILFNATVDSDDTKYNGLFLDLNDYLSEDLTPNIMTMFEEEPDRQRFLQRRWKERSTVHRSSRENGRLPIR